MGVDWRSLVKVLEAQVPALVDLLEKTGKEAVAKMATVSLPAAQEGEKLLQAIASNTAGAAMGVLSQADAEAANKSYWEAFRLVGKTLIEQTEQAAYAEFETTIARLEEIGLGVLGEIGSIIVKGII